jgi:hypothetical protein
MAKKQPDSLMNRALAYGFKEMAYDRMTTDQEQNWFLGHMVLFAKSEEKRIRRAIAPALRELKRMNLGSRYYEALLTIDRVTRSAQTKKERP